MTTPAYYANDTILPESDMCIITSWKSNQLMSICSPAVDYFLLCLAISGWCNISLAVYGWERLFGHSEKGCLPLQAEQVWPYLQSGAYVHWLPSLLLYSKQIGTDFFSPIHHPCDDLSCTMGCRVVTKVHSDVACSSLRQILQCWSILALPTVSWLCQQKSHCTGWDPLLPSPGF